MRYQDPTLQEKLSAEYVMGNLTGQARRRFERLLLKYPELQAYVTAWSARLQPLNEDIEPVSPPKSVWANIMERIEGTSPTSLWQKTIFWPKLVMAASTVLLVFAIFFYFNFTPTKHGVIVMNQQAETEWVVEARYRSQRVVVETVTPPKLPENKVCILWLVWKDGKTTSLGVLSDKIGKTEMLFPKDLKRKPEKANVMVSIENKDENANKPTGKIVFNGPWIRL